MLAWRKLTSSKWEDAWAESLAFLGGTRLAITSVPGSRTIRLEAFALSKKEAALLTARFGGSVREARIRAAASPPARRPIRIREKLAVAHSAKALAAARRAHPLREVILIPAGAAFGTGGHATTSCCLRLLCDASGALQGRKWELLDLGTGSGVLAIAAARLGAGRVEAWDFDRDAVRTARENARANGVSRIVVKKGDVLAPMSRRRWAVVSANLYSEVLIRASRRIAGAVKPGGWLILSGILREQEAACAEAFETLGVKLEKRVHAGKWTTLLWRKPPRAAGGGSSLKTSRTGRKTIDAAGGAR